jgi:hypothetical protein
MVGFILIVTVWFYGSTGREPVMRAYVMDTAGQCMSVRGKVLAHESGRPEIRLVRAQCLGVNVSGEGNSI